MNNKFLSNDNGKIRSLEDYLAPKNAFSDRGLWAYTTGSHSTGQYGVTELNTYNAGYGFMQVDKNDVWKKLIPGFSNYSVALKNDNTLWIAGTYIPNTKGMGSSSVSRKVSDFQQIGLDSDWADAADYSGGILAIKTDGTLWTLGTGVEGRIGDGTVDVVRLSFVKIGSATDWSKVSGGLSNIAIKTDGTAWVWGSNSSGQLGIGDTIARSSPVQLGGTWSSIVSRNIMTMGIKTDGTLWAWGANSYGGVNGILGGILLYSEVNGSSSTPVQQGALSNWGNVSSTVFLPGASAQDGNFMVVIKQDGTLWTQGDNSEGQLGVGDIVDRSSPTQVGSLTNWSKVSSGYRSARAIKSDGTLWAWGYNGEGQLGTGTTTRRSSPVQIGSDTNWTHVQAGVRNTIAVKSDNTLWMTGLNDYGQLGIASISDKTSFVQVGETAGSPVATISTITNSLLGAASLTASTSNTGDDNFWTLTLPWSVTYFGTSYSTIYIGTNSYITFGSGSSAYSALSASNPAVPKIFIVSGDRSGQRIYYGTEGTAPNRTYRVVFEGSTGTSGTLGSPTLLWEAVFYENDATKIDIQCGSLGSANNTGISGVYTNNAVVASFPGGSNIQNTGITLTTSIASIPGMAAITDAVWGASGSEIINYHTSAYISTTGKLYTWGSSRSGVTGVNTSTGSFSSPVQVGSDTNWSKIWLGSYLSTAIALKTDGTLWAWGDNSYGILGLGDGVSRSSPVQIGSGTTWSSVRILTRSVLATKTDGTLWGWGNNNDLVLVGQQSFSTISSPIQMGVGTDWVEIAHSGSFAYGIKGTGSTKTLMSWGLNDTNLAFTASGTSIPVAASSPCQVGSMNNWSKVFINGEGTAFAIKTDGTLWGWGWSGGGWGSLGLGNTLNTSSPAQIGSMTNWADVGYGYQSNFFLKTDGTLWGAGYIMYQASSLLQNAYSSPVQLGNSTDWYKIGPGSSYGVAAIKLPYTE